MASTDRWEPVSSLPALEFNRRIADPDVFCGGGSVAALACAGAAASALLVFRLSYRRKSNADRRDEITAAIDALESLTERFYADADNDIASLQALLDAQRESRQTADRVPYFAALRRAALTPIAIAEGAIALIEHVIPHLPIATRFTISDLGAAATIAEGAARAALLTAEVNIELLRDDSDSVAVADELRARWDSARQRVSALVSDVERATREAVLGRELDGGSR
ncbi:MAG: cyclodeaminase/cyclohydrolase family protein [Thermomicrobiales bacterium]|nr:cyclodeaminase/cyclohydrolase family protein [Thermomicrobiales bacterium]